MRKAKIFFVIIIVSAIGGGTAAFHARKFSFNYCTTIALGNCSLCPNFTPAAKVGIGGTYLCYTEALHAADCNNISGHTLPCRFTATLIKDE